MTVLLVTNDEAVAASADRALRLRDGVVAPDPA
jgi:predicted ABC-type transport system involved in lysophospholipase L1 biosynthesis ATPase subunit